MKRYLIAFCGIGMLAFVLVRYTPPPTLVSAGNQPTSPTNTGFCESLVDEQANGCVTLLEATSADLTENVVYVNGIQNTYENHFNALVKIQIAFHGAAMIGVYNASAGKEDGIDNDIGEALGDLSQCMKIGNGYSNNIAVVRLVKQIIQYDGKLTVVGHSQGAAIISSALCDIRRNDEKFDFTRLKIYTLGSVGVMFMPGPEYHHCIREFDPLMMLHIASLGWHIAPGIPMPYEEIWDAEVTILPPAPIPWLSFWGKSLKEIGLILVESQHGLDNYIRDCPLP